MPDTLSLRNLRCSAIWNGCKCDRYPHEGNGHVWRNTLDGDLVDPALYPSAAHIDALTATLRPYVRHGATCVLQAVRDNAPDDELCTCGLREVWREPHDA